MRITSTKIKTFCAALVLTALFSLFISIPAHAAANTSINYQGKLYTSSGSAVANATYSIQFKLYTAATGGAAIWSETQSVQTTGGLFTALLGSVTPFTNVDWNQPLYLGITVESDSEMSPRHTIGSVPSAHTITGLLGVAQGGTGTSTQFATGTVLFAGANGAYIGDPSTLYIDASNRRLGIGTTTPQGMLHVVGGGNIALFDASTQSASTTAALSLIANGDRWNVSAGGSVSAIPNSFSIYNATDAAYRLVISDSGSVGIGTTTPTAQFHTTGSVRFQVFGAGTLTTDANGNLSVSSDERLKKVTGSFKTGLAAVRGLQPIRYQWNEISGLETESIYAGFSAQNVLENIEDAVGVDNRGYFTLNDRPILAASVNAIKELDVDLQSLSSTTAPLTDDDGSQTFVGRFLERLVLWFADTANGIGNFFAKSLRAKDTLCINDTCIGETELKDMLADRVTTSASSGATSTPSNASSSNNATSTPPTLILSGESHMTTTAGNSYVEPGYSATSGLGVDITASTTITVSPATFNEENLAEGEYIFTYTIVDNGNSASITRVLTVTPADGGGTATSTEPQ